MHQILSRKDAKRFGKNRYFTGVPCKRGHVAERNTTSALCIECIALHDANTYKKRAGHHKRLVRARVKQREQFEPGYQARRMKEWRSNNRTRWLADRLYQNAKRRQRNVKWANQKAVKKIYHQAADLTIKTGIIHHVHHIVPLRALQNTVCGLHCEFNLTILTEDQHNRLHQKIRNGDTVF